MKIRKSKLKRITGQNWFNRWTRDLSGLFRYNYSLNFCGVIEMENTI